MKRTIKYHALRLWFPLLTLFILGYFVYYFLYGDHGYFAFEKVQKQLEEAKQRLSQKQADFDQLAHRVSLLRTDNLDKDLLEERVRAMLDYVEKADTVIIDEEEGETPAS